MRSYSVGVLISIYLPGAASKETVNLILSSMILYPLGLLTFNTKARPNGVLAGRSTQGNMLIISTRSSVTFGFPASSVGRRPAQPITPDTPKIIINNINNGFRIMNLLCINNQFSLQN